MNYEDVVLRSSAARSSFDDIESQVSDWLLLNDSDRQGLLEGNKRWFSEEVVFESSVFLYLDLSESEDVVARVVETQKQCSDVLDGHFNPAPANLVHATILTDIVADSPLPESEVRFVEGRYRTLLSKLPAFSAFVLGPRVTRGGVILECRVYEGAFFEMRQRALELGSVSDRTPRIPSIEYATLGYLTGGGRSEIAKLRDALSFSGNNAPPIEVRVGAACIARTVNKSLVLPPHRIPLTQRQVAEITGNREVLNQVSDARERIMLTQYFRQHA